MRQHPSWVYTLFFRDRELILGIDLENSIMSRNNSETRTNVSVQERKRWPLYLLVIDIIWYGSVCTFTILSICFYQFLLNFSHRPYLIDELQVPMESK